MAGMRQRSAAVLVAAALVFGHDGCGGKAAEQSAPSKPALPDKPQRHAPPAAAPEGMVSIPEATFFMGIAPGDHGMEVGKMTKVGSFFIDKLEVTADQYDACVRNAGCTPIASHRAGCNAPGGKLGNHPINCVDWYQADRYCKASGKRLPTEAEWELAARGTDRRIYPWGNQDPGEQLCWQGRPGKEKMRTCVVGSFPAGASPYGVLDMAGNVMELTATDDTANTISHTVIVKGGGYVFDPMEGDWHPTRVDVHTSARTDEQEPWLGFRCARDVAAP